MKNGRPHFSRRRNLLALLAGVLLAPKAVARATSFAPVVPGYVMRFPHDEGSHPDFRLEWWYVTGWLNAAATAALGFQITFFRVRPEFKSDNPSAFAPRQIMIAHAALSDPAHGRLIHDQRAARAGFDLAGAAEGGMRVWIDDWSLHARGAKYQARLPTASFDLDLAFTPTQPPLLQGENGLSRKGPAPEAASYYYSLPHLAVDGTLTRAGTQRGITGRAWLDHEWSSSYLPEEAVGWDWVGINLDDGGALMAFRMRGKNGTVVWAGGSYRTAAGGSRSFLPQDVRIVPQREWRSPRTGARYPVACAIRAGDLDLLIEPLMDDQEHDTRASTGTIYWEGAVRVLRGGKPSGQGYLELTGYWRPQRL